MKYATIIKLIMGGAATIGLVTTVNVFGKCQTVDKLKKNSTRNQHPNSSPNDDIIDIDVVDDDELNAAT